VQTEKPRKGQSSAGQIDKTYRGAESLIKVRSAFKQGSGVGLSSCWRKRCSGPGWNTGK
jgi:hypothetical protein